MRILTDYEFRNELASGERVAAARIGQMRAVTALHNAEKNLWLAIFRHELP
jgi:hypothetical protein